MGFCKLFLILWLLVYSLFSFFYGIIERLFMVSFYNIVKNNNSKVFRDGMPKNWRQPFNK